MRIERASGHRLGEAIDLSNIATAYAGMGQPQTAIRYYKKAADIDRAIENKHGHATTLLNISITLKQMGMLEQAVTQAEEALTIFKQIKAVETTEVSAMVARFRRQIPKGMKGVIDPPHRER